MELEFNIRTDEELLKEFDESLPEFQWFIEEYFKPIVLEKLQHARKKQQIVEMRDILNDIWFALPSNKFNIIENPKGWNKFLNVITD